MTLTYDAVVAGAGPTGSATARDVARAGFRVLILEEHRVVGEPNHCSGLVTPRTLALAGADESIVLNSIRGARVTSASGRSVGLGGDRTQALVIDRAAFDCQLADQALAAGAELHTSTRLSAIERDGVGLQLTIEHAGRREVVETRLLIGADGAQSRVARWLDPVARRRERVVGLGAEVEVATPHVDQVEVFVGQTLAPGFFAWLIPVSDGPARLGIATDSRMRPTQALDGLLRAFPARFAGLRVERWSGGVVPLTLVEKPYGDNVMLVGDAAGQVKPTSGGGIYTGLVGAKHAARTAVVALTEGRLSIDRLSAYHAAWQTELGAEFDRMALLRRLFLGLSDGDLGRLLFLLQAPFSQRMIARYGDIDFPSGIVAKLVSTLAPLLRGTKPVNPRSRDLASTR